MGLKLENVHAPHTWSAAEAAEIGGIAILVQGLERGLDLLGVFLRLRLRRNPRDLPLFDNKRLPFGEAHGYGHSEGLSDLAIAVPNQGERKLILVLEPLLRLDGVFAHPDYLQSFLIQIRERVAERTCLCRAASGARLGVEINQRRSLGVNICKVDGLTVLIFGGDNRRGRADGEWFSSARKRKQAYRGKAQKW
jgi:hypothetical protein